MGGGLIRRDSGGGKIALVVLESAPPAVADFDDTAGDVEEGAYREAIEGVWLTELRTDGRPGCSSFASSTSSLSSILFPDSVAPPSDDFPFSID